VSRGTGRSKGGVTGRSKWAVTREWLGGGSGTLALLVVCAIVLSTPAGGEAAPADQPWAPQLLDRVERAVAAYNEAPERYLGSVEGTVLERPVALVALDQRVNVTVAGDDGSRTAFSVRTTDTGRIEEFAREGRPDATVRVVVEQSLLDRLVAGTVTGDVLAGAVLAGDVRVECIPRRVLSDPTNARCLLLHVPSHPLQAGAGVAIVGATVLWWTRLLELLRAVRIRVERTLATAIARLTSDPVLSRSTFETVLKAVGILQAAEWVRERLRQVLGRLSRLVGAGRRSDDATAGSEQDAEPEPRPRT
jgi:hypothetical protein